MSTEKRFTVVGTARNSDGVLKIRWANDLSSRTKALVKNGVSEIELIELPEPMTKNSAVIYYLNNYEGLTAEQKEVLEMRLSDSERVAKRKDMKDTLSTGTGVEESVDDDVVDEAAH